MIKLTHIKHTIASVEIGVNNTVGLHFFSNNRQQRCGLRVADNDAIQPYRHTLKVRILRFYPQPNDLVYIY